MVRSTALANGSFTNDAQIVECATAGGRRVRLVVKVLVDNPEMAARSAVASFHAAVLARQHGIPVPEPLLLDEGGELLGAPVVVSRFVEGRQEANPVDPEQWARDLAWQLARIHAIRPTTTERALLFDGNHQSLYFTRGAHPALMQGHPLSADILQAVGQLQATAVPTPPVLVHLDYWHGNVLWRDGRIAAVLDWDFAGYGDPAIDVANFRMNMYLRGIREAADYFLTAYEQRVGAAVQNLGLRELAAAAQCLPSPVRWVPGHTELGGAPIADDRAIAQYEEFVSSALRRAYEGTLSARRRRP